MCTDDCDAASLGTQICCDPVNKIATVLLTNRVYPVADEAGDDARRSTNLKRALEDTAGAVLPS